MVYQAGHDRDNIFDSHLPIFHLASSRERAMHRAKHDTSRASVTRRRRFQIVVYFQSSAEEIPPNEDLTSLEEDEPDTARSVPIATVVELSAPFSDVSCSIGMYQRVEVVQVVLLYQGW